MDPRCFGATIVLLVATAAFGQSEADRTPREVPQNPCGVFIPILSFERGGRSYQLLRAEPSGGGPAITITHPGKNRSVIFRQGWEFLGLSDGNDGFWYRLDELEPASRFGPRLAYFDSLLAYDYEWIEPDDARQLIGERPAEVIEALKQHDFERLANLVHPTSGLKVSVYTYVKTQNPVFSREQVRAARSDTSHYFLDYADGSGDPIYSTLPEWLDGYGRANYAAADSVSYNRQIWSGNTINNVFESFPGSIVVEYYFAGRGEMADFNWLSRRFVFLKHEDAWYLAGIVDDFWTI